MSEQINPQRGEEKDLSSGLLLSVESLRGGSKLNAADSDASNKDTDSANIAESLGLDTDGSNASDTDSSDTTGDSSGDSDTHGDADTSDADIDQADGNDLGRDADGMNPLGIGGGDADSSDTTRDADSSDAR